MSATISRSPCLRKRPNNITVLGEWTCFKRRGDLLVLLADVARINDKGLLKDYFSFSLNAFITLWSRVGYQLSNSEEDLIKNTLIAKDQMILLPFNDAAEFTSQHLIKQAKLLLRVFNPILKENSIPTTDTITLEPQSDSDGSREPSDDDCNACEKLPDVDGKSAKQRSSKRGERALNELECAGGSEDSSKKRKTGNSGERKTELFVSLNLIQPRSFNACHPPPPLSLSALIPSVPQYPNFCASIKDSRLKLLKILPKLKIYLIKCIKLVFE